MDTGKIRVILADDHPVVRTGIRALLERADDILVVAETGKGKEVFALIEQLAPDVLLLDMEMPDLSGMEVAMRLKQSAARVRVLALSAYDDEQYIRNLLISGAAGYLTKEEAAEGIIDAVRGVARGEEGWFSRRAIAQLSALTRQDAHQGAKELTHREFDVLRLLTAGKTNQEIGLELGISEKTVEKHVGALFTKLRVTSRVEAAVLAVQQGLV
ncbi:MAG: response regulator transcription factor [Caldilineaceae bacterium]|nr:response regulator transcription factor [Caldilineaceae bacterium]